MDARTKEDFKEKLEWLVFWGCICFAAGLVGTALFLEDRLR